MLQHRGGGFLKTFIKMQNKSKTKRAEKELELISDCLPYLPKGKYFITLAVCNKTHYFSKS